MKQTLVVTRKFLLFILCFQLTGCQKLIDRIFRGHHHDSSCKIKSIKQEIVEGAFRTATFYNNTHGNPDSVIFDIGAGSAGAQFFYFHYDQQHRLVAFDSYYDRDPHNYFFKHTYVYSPAGRIITDTIKISQAGRWTTVLDLHYDLSGKVISEVGRVIESDGEPVPEPEPFTVSYPYNSRGNIELVNHTYDEKINFLKTSRVLLFTERNYSRNNPMGASSYNDRDLPLGFPGFEPNLFPTSHWGIIQRNAPVEITYDCENDSGAGHWDY